MKIEVDGGTRLALIVVEILLLSALESKRYNSTAGNSFNKSLNLKV
jgi:hypothetical protein